VLPGETSGLLCQDVQRGMLTRGVGALAAIHGQVRLAALLAAPAGHGAHARRQGILLGQLHILLTGLLTGQLTGRCARPGPDRAKAPLGQGFWQDLLAGHLHRSAPLTKAQEPGEEAAAAEGAAAVLRLRRRDDAVTDHRGGRGSARGAQQLWVAGAAEELLGSCRKLRGARPEG
jgi:hypothetical protein